MPKVDIPKIEPIDEINWILLQSNYQVIPQVPFRASITGPSGSGKSVLLANLILNIYRNVFSRMFIWFPSIEVDSIWLPVKKYIKQQLKSRYW